MFIKHPYSANKNDSFELTIKSKFTLNKIINIISYMSKKIHSLRGSHSLRHLCHTNVNITSKFVRHPRYKIHDPQVSDAPDDLDILIALKKGVRLCSQHPISNFISYDRLSPQYYVFVTNLSNIDIPKSIHEALQKTEWR